MNRASSRAARRAISIASSLPTWMVSVIRLVSRFCGMNPAPMPWILWGPGSPPEITGDGLQVPVQLAQPARGAGQGAARADAAHQRVDPAVGVGPDLLRGGPVV